MTLTPETVLACAEAALTAQPPAFPLHATVAVNPAVGYTELPFPAAAGRLRALAGAPFTAPRETVRQALREGKLLDEDLKAALAKAPRPCPPPSSKRVFGSPRPLPSPCPRCWILRKSCLSGPGAKGWRIAWGLLP